MVYGLIDCNSFYVSAEVLFRPWLRDQAVVVASNNDGCVVARNDPAKALGIKMGQPVFQIDHLIKAGKLHLFSSNYALYQSISNRVMAIIEEMAPRVSIYSIDESFVDLSGVQDPEQWAREIRQTIGSRLGMPVGVGIGPTLTLAKLANWAAKRWKAKTGCVVDISDPVRREWLLKYTPVNEVWGIGSRITERLGQGMGIKTAWDLTQTDPKLLRRHLGLPIERTARELSGQPCYPFGLDETPERKAMIASTRSFGNRLYALADLEKAVAAFVSIAASKLRKQNSLAGCLQVFARTSPFDKGMQYGGNRIMQLPYPTSDTRDLTRAALQGLNHLFREGPAYAKAGVILSAFIDPFAVTGDLFAAKPRENSESLMRVMDAINAKQGRGTIRLAAESNEAAWKMKQQFLSPSYTTKWDDIPHVGAGTPIST